MHNTRFAGCAAKVALVYCTLAGSCQNIPAQPKTDSPSAHHAAASSQLSGVSAPARTSIKLIATETRPDGQTPESCQQILAVLLPYIQAYPHPIGWTWFVACDEAVWARIQKHQGNQVGSGILAITNRPALSTIIRGSAMLHPYSDDYRAQPEHIVAHELCHIYLDSSDESKVDELATKWVNERKLKHLGVLTP